PGKPAPTHPGRGRSMAGRPVRSLDGMTVATTLFRFDDSYAREVPGLSVPWAAAPVPAPELLGLNEELATELGAGPAALRARPGEHGDGAPRQRRSPVGRQRALAGRGRGAVAGRGDRHPGSPP